jgi:hypothetical protein
MKRLSLTILLLATPTLAAPEPPPASPTPSGPLYIAFKQFCLDTHLDPTQLDQAMKSVPFAMHQKPDFKTTVGTTKIWDFSLQDHQMALRVGKTVEFVDAKRERKAEFCRVASEQPDSLGANRVKTWIGFPNDRSPTLPLMFIMKDGRPVVLNGYPSITEASDNGRAWRLIVGDYPLRSDAMMSRYSAPTARTIPPAPKVVQYHPPDKPYATWTPEERRALNAHLFSTCIFAMADMSNLTANLPQDIKMPYAKSLSATCIEHRTPKDYLGRDHLNSESRDLYNQAKAKVPGLPDPETYAKYFEKFGEPAQQDSQKQPHP